MPLIPAEYGAECRHEVRPWEDIKTGYTHFAEGDVAVAKITPCFENGKSTIFRGLTSGIGAGTTELHIVRPIIVSPEYILIFVKSPFFIDPGIPRMTGTAGQKRVPIDYFAYTPFPLPPLAEQHRIVSKVDELMALCDRLEAAQTERESRRNRLAAASLHRLNNGADADEFREHARFHLSHLPRLTTRPEHVQQFRQTILNLAVRGKLVPQDPNDEPASELLKYIYAEKLRRLKEGTPKRTHITSTFDTTEIPAAVPDGWEWVKLGNLLLGDSQNGYSKKPDNAADGIPILRISAGTVRKDGIVAEEEHKLIGGVSTAQKGQYELQPGDLLACRFNGNRSLVGRLSLYLGYLRIKPIYPDKLIRLRLLSQFVLPKLVRCFGESDVVRKDIETYCATTVGNWGISASNLKEVRIPLPPLPEQHRIEAKVDELMALCDRLEAQLNTTRTESSRLLEAVLHEALI
jgi:type I restriction enzyme S subunit